MFEIGGLSPQRYLMMSVKRPLNQCLLLMRMILSTRAFQLVPPAKNIPWFAKFWHIYVIAQKLLLR